MSGNTQLIHQSIKSALKSSAWRVSCTRHARAHKSRRWHVCCTMHFRLLYIRASRFSLLSEQAALPRFVIGKFPRGSFVRSLVQSIDRYCRRGSVVAPQPAQEPWNSANSCGTVWRTLRVRFTHESFFRHYAQIFQGQWRRRREDSLISNNSRFHWKE